MRGKNGANTDVFASILTKQGRKNPPKNEFWILMHLLQGWESRTTPKSTVNSRSLRKSEDTFLQAPSRMPERYISRTELPRKAELFANDFAPDYSAFKESDLPDYHLFSNSAGGKNTQPESDNEWDATETKVETEAVEGNVIRPGYNQRGHWSQDPDADNYGKDSAKYMVISKLDTMCETANKQNRENIISFADDFRSFDENSICRVYYLNDKDGAKNFGHTGVLLVNNKAHGLLFSYGAATGNFVYGDARMNVGVYTPNDVWNILKGREIVVLSTKGFNTYEQYERWVYYDVSAEDGKKMFDTAGKAMFDLDKYAILWNNCDQVVNEIFDAGGEHVTSAIWPNLTYEKEYFQYNVKETYQDIKKISLKLYNKLKNIWE